MALQSQIAAADNTPTAPLDAGGVGGHDPLLTLYDNTEAQLALAEQCVRRVLGDDVDDLLQALGLIDTGGGDTKRLRCGACGAFKPAEQFHRHSGKGSRGRRWRCKRCESTAKGVTA